MNINIINLHKSYRNSLGGINRNVLCGANLNINKGEKIAIMGPSGSGKTTLLNLIGSLDKPDEGEVFIGDINLAEMTEKEILHYRNNKAGFVFQFHNLLPQCTLWENILLPTLPFKGDKTHIYHKANELINYLGISEQRNNKPGELSGGECQRAAVARALINDPEIILADEPTGSLDSKNAERLIDLLLNISNSMNISLIIATHSKEIAEKTDKIYRISNGIFEYLKG